MFKNVASQKIALFAFDTTTGAPKTGDAANITPYVSKDYGTVTVLGTTTATEMDATNAKGWYSFVLTQGETNADMCLFTGKSSTANISIVGVLLTTVYASFTSAVAQTGDSYARIGAPVGASISADIAEIEAETDAIQTSTAGLTFTVANQVDANVLTFPVSFRPGIRKNTALTNFEIVMTDSTNHNPATGKTVSVTRSIDHAAFGAGTLSAVTELANGVYYFDWGAGDLNGSIIMLRATATGCDDLLLLIATNP